MVRRSSAIRFLATAFAALLIAVGIAVAGYSFLLSLRQPAVVTTAQPDLELRLLVVPAPRLLKLEARPHAFATPAALVGAIRADQRPARLLVRGLDRDIVNPGDATSSSAGVAVFAPTTGARLAWHPLADATVSPDGLVIELTPPSAPFVVTVAPDEASAEHGYLARATLDPRGNIRDFSMTAPVVRVRLVTANGRPAGPFQLVRVGARDWLAQGAAAGGLRLDDGSVTLVLGAGDYEVVDPIRSAVRQRFTAKTEGDGTPIEVTLTARLTRPRDPQK